MREKGKLCYSSTTVQFRPLYLKKVSFRNTKVSFFRYFSISLTTSLATIFKRTRSYAFTSMNFNEGSIHRDRSRFSLSAIENKLFPFRKKITTFDMTFHIVQKHPMTLFYVMQKQTIRETATSEIQHR